MANHLENDINEIITETYEDLKMCEVVDWDDYYQQLEHDMAREEERQLTEPSTGEDDDSDFEKGDEFIKDDEYYPEDEEDFTDENWDD